MGVACAHVESGLRSGTRQMPEEVNRIVTDHLSELLFCPTEAAVENLRREGLEARTRVTGDVMFDAVLQFRDRAERQGGELARRWKPGEFALATIHRPVNTDNPARLLGMLRAIDVAARNVCPVVLPLHPRTAARLAQTDWRPESIHVIGPVPYLEMLLLESRARFILTDSGGVQKEAYFFRKPCITLREETEWVETLANGCNVLVGSDPDRIAGAIARAGSGEGPWTAVYGDGNAGERIAVALAA